MPTVNCGFSDQPGRSGQQALVNEGPTLLVEIGFDPNFRSGSGERPDIPDDLLPALVDTGAVESCIDADLAAELGLAVAEQGQIAGVGGLSVADIYIAQIYVPVLEVPIYGRFAGARLRAGGQPYSALIGRNFLQHYRMAYDGRSGRVTISSD